MIYGSPERKQILQGCAAKLFLIWVCFFSQVCFITLQIVQEGKMLPDLNDFLPSLHIQIISHAVWWS